VLALKQTFPARFGSFKYQYYSSCSYRFYNGVSIEESNSQIMKRGMRGLFVQDLKTGKVNGWAFEAFADKPFAFKGVTIAPNDFKPLNAPNLKSAEDNKQWDCSVQRDVFDNVHCSRSVSDAPEIAPGSEVRFWGYRSDGRNHSWEASQSKTVLEGPVDSSPT